MELNDRVTRVALAALLLLGVLAFFALATDFGKNLDNKHHDKATVAAINTSTTNETFLPPTTQTTFPIVTTTLPVVVTTPAVTTTPTTRATTATTKKPTTPTTKKPAATTTTLPAPADGKQDSDNTGTFTQNADGTYSGLAAPPACGAADAFCFEVGTQPAADPHEVKIVAVLKNKTARTATFPGGLKITVTLKNGGVETQFQMDASTIASLAPGEGVTITSETSFISAGSYTFTASCQAAFA